MQPEADLMAEAVLFSPQMNRSAARAGPARRLGTDQRRVMGSGPPARR